MRHSEISERIVASFSRSAGGALFYVKNPLKNYRKYVEKMLPRWFNKSGQYEGELDRDYPIRWKGPQIDKMLGLAISDNFTFVQQTSDGQIIKEEGKITARIQGGGIYIAVMLY